MHRFVPKATRIPAETQASSFDGWTNLRRGSMTIVETDGSISKPAKHALTVDLTNHKLFVRNGGTALMTSDGFLQLDYKGVSFESKSINGVVVAYLLQCNADGTPYRRYGELSFVTTGAEVVGAVVQPSGLAPEEVGDPSVSMLQRIQALNCVVEMISEACLWRDQGAKPLALICFVTNISNGRFSSACQRVAVESGCYVRNLVQRCTPQCAREASYNLSLKLSNGTSPTAFSMYQNVQPLQLGAFCTAAPTWWIEPR